ncbi:UTP11 family protein [Pleurotus pulmonarius]
MTSSLRNSIHRRNHKERSQLAHRSKLGFLEKHKDYVKRARDYHSKQDRLTRLRQKAADRNKDEFYFSMNKEKTRGGVHIKDRGNVALPTDMVKVLKTQDENYVRTARAAGLKKIDKIKGQLTAMVDLLKPSQDDTDGQLDVAELDTLRDAGLIQPSTSKRKRSTKHIIFVDNEAEARRLLGSEKQQPSPSTSNVASEPSTRIDLGWKAPAVKSKKRRHSQPQSADTPTDEADERQTESTTPSARKKLLLELRARLHRDKMLRYTQREFEMQRLMMGKGARQKIQGTEKVEEGNSDEEDDPRSRKGGRKVVDEQAYKPRVYKWRRERKR